MKRGLSSLVATALSSSSSSSSSSLALASCSEPLYKALYLKRLSEVPGRDTISTDSFNGIIGRNALKTLHSEAFQRVAPSLDQFVMDLGSSHSGGRMNIKDFIHEVLEKEPFLNLSYSNNRQGLSNCPARNFMESVMFFLERMYKVGPFSVSCIMNEIICSPRFEKNEPLRFEMFQRAVASFKQDFTPSLYSISRIADLQTDPRHLRFLFEVCKNFFDQRLVALFCSIINKGKNVTLACDILDHVVKHLPHTAFIFSQERFQIAIVILFSEADQMHTYFDWYKRHGEFIKPALLREKYYATLAKRCLAADMDKAVIDIMSVVKERSVSIWNIYNECLLHLLQKHDAKYEEGMMTCTVKTEIARGSYDDLFRLINEMYSSDQPPGKSAYVTMAGHFLYWNQMDSLQRLLDLAKERDKNWEFKRGVVVRETLHRLSVTRTFYHLKADISEKYLPQFHKDGTDRHHVSVPEMWSKWEGNVSERLQFYDESLEFFLKHVPESESFPIAPLLSLFGNRGDIIDLVSWFFNCEADFTDATVWTRFFQVFRIPLLYFRVIPCDGVESSGLYQVDLSSKYGRPVPPVISSFAGKSICDLIVHIYEWLEEHHPGIYSEKSVLYEVLNSLAFNGCGNQEFQRLFEHNNLSMHGNRMRRVWEDFNQYLSIQKYCEEGKHLSFADMKRLKTERLVQSLSLDRKQLNYRLRMLVKKAAQNGADGDHARSQLVTMVKTFKMSMFRESFRAIFCMHNTRVPLVCKRIAIRRVELAPIYAKSSEGSYEDIVKRFSRMQMSTLDIVRFNPTLFFHNNKDLLC